MVFKKKKKKEIPRLTDGNGGNYPTSTFVVRLNESGYHYGYATQKMWEELWRHWGTVQIKSTGDSIAIRYFAEEGMHESLFADNYQSAPNLPDALALALLQTIGQRKTDGKR